MLSEFDVLKCLLGGYELVNGTDIDFIEGELSSFYLVWKSFLYRERLDA